MTTKDYVWELKSGSFILTVVQYEVDTIEHLGV